MPHLNETAEPATQAKPAEHTEPSARALTSEVLARHERRHNCAQSVACAFSRFTPVDEDTLFRMMEGFGAGMGGNAETCGVVSAGVAVISACASDGSAQRTTKEHTYEVAKGFVEAFRATHGTTCCRELKELSSVPAPHRCDAYMESGTQLLLETLQKRNLA
ncbi:C-GCAxxG-C-C family protein [Adlercreutzia sp. ZJ242]|uniref:C-GCAxxG-C-C family protein n=1 Tax=Adlercreutzia sp. ZJ242 TaxID=2709409 RepID=UPI0013EBD61E|nr:C-GCAxxG-C-C family protein [Adlercreutzia sp. ZJ242]